MARVVITMEGGLIQHIMADQEDVKVMVLDFDTEGGDDERIKEFEGNRGLCLSRGGRRGPGAGRRNRNEPLFK